MRHRMANTLRRTDKTHTHIGQRKVEIGRERARVRGRGEWQNKNNIPKCICIKMCVQYVFLRVTVPVTGRVLCGAGRDFFCCCCSNLLLWLVGLAKQAGAAVFEPRTSIKRYSKFMNTFPSYSSSLLRCLLLWFRKR